MNSRGLAFGEPDKLTLRRRIVYTILLLLVFRLLAVIPILNVDEQRLNQLLAANPLLGAIDLFAGGGVLIHFSIVAAGILPYLVALAVVKGVAWAIPGLRDLQRQGEKGRDRIELYSKLLSIPLAFVFAWNLSHYLARQTGLFPGRIPWLTPASFFPSLLVVGLVTLGSVISTFITGLITKKGVSSGEGVVLLVGSSLGFVRQFMHTLHGPGGVSLVAERLGLMGAAGLVVVSLSLCLTRAQRRIPIWSAKRADRSAHTYLPLALNRGGIQPVSAAMGVFTLLQFGRAALASWFGNDRPPPGRWMAALTAPTSGAYWLVLAALIVLFTYVYNFSALWQPYSDSDLGLAEQLRRQGNFIPNVRPGLQTQAYLSRVIARITLPAGLGLALLTAGLPYAILRLTGKNILVSVLSAIVVVKTLDELRNAMQAYATMDKYDGFLTSGRKRRDRGQGPLA